VEAYKENEMVKCKKHPRYQAIKVPSSGCRTCLTIYRAEQARKMEAESQSSEQTLRKTLLEIKGEVSRMGFGTNRSISGSDAVDYLNDLYYRLKEVPL
jgi:hypothetical protein